MVRIKSTEMNKYLNICKEDVGELQYLQYAGVVYR